MKQAKKGYWLLVLLIVLVPGCANWRFLRKFRPLLEKDLALNQQYKSFEDSLPNDKHWSENVSTLNEIVRQKSEILESLKTLSPTPDYKTTYDVFVEDLNNSIGYLKKETELINKNTEYGLWLARSMFKGSIGHDVSEAGLNKAKEEVLKIQEELTVQAERCNFSQGRLAQLVASKEILPQYKSISYPKYQKGYVGYKVRQ